MRTVQVSGTVAADIQWGTVGEWVSGIGALAAVAVALGVVFRDRKREREHFVYDVTVTEPTLSHYSLNRQEHHALSSTIVNHAPVFIYDLTASFEWGGTKYHAERRHRLGPDASHTATAEVPPEARDLLDRGVEPVVTVSFRDPDGWTMRRGYHGRWFITRRRLKR